MKNLKTFKNFKESVFVTKDEVDELLDKITSSGITSLSDVEKNRLNLFSEDDKEIIKIIEEMGDLTAEFMEVNNKIKELMSEYKTEEAKSLMSKWNSLDKKMTVLEKSFKKWGIELGDERLFNLMKKIRPDIYSANAE